MRSVMAIIIGVALGCGGAKPAGQERDVPSCDEVAEHLMDLAVRGGEVEAGGELAVGVRAEHTRQCQEDNWSPERRRCLMAKATQEAALDCPAR
jgi:hypothetical protein